MLQHESKGHMRMVLFCESLKRRYLEALQDKAFRIYNSIVLEDKRKYFSLCFHVLSNENSALRKLLHPGSVATCLLILTFHFSSFTSQGSALLRLLGAGRAAAMGALSWQWEHPESPWIIIVT